MGSIYIILSTSGVGGAEKRFTDNWYQLLHDFGMDVHLVIDAKTHGSLLAQAAYSEKLQPNDHLHILNFGGGRFVDYCKAINAFLITRPMKGIVHFPLAAVPGIQRRFGHKVVVSWVNSAMPPLSWARWKLSVGAWMALWAADKIDVLNPENVRKLSRISNFRKKISLTAGGTQVDSRQFRVGNKSGDFVFLGRVEPEKQCLRFAYCLPELHRLLQQAGYEGYRFRIFGDGSDASTLNFLLGQSEYRAIPVEFGFSSNPEEVLGRASVYFSLQRTSNYPSKALAEAMACGAFPVLTRVGESELMVNQCPYYSFVPKDFTAIDLFKALLGYLSLTSEIKNDVVAKNSQYAVARFTPRLQAAYFANIYEELGSKSEES